MRHSAFRITLDDLFGPDLDAEIASLRDLIEGLPGDEDRFAPPDDQGWAEAREELSFNRREEAEAEAERRGRVRFWHIVSIGEPVAAFRMGPGGSVEEIDNDTSGWNSTYFSLFPPLGVWLTDVRWAIERSIRDGREAARIAVRELREMIGRFSGFKRKAARRSALAIRQALAKLRSGTTDVIRAVSATPALRDLVAELLSPSVVAAGGGPGSFVLRI